MLTVIVDLCWRETLAIMYSYDPSRLRLSLLDHIRSQFRMLLFAEFFSNLQADSYRCEES